MTELIFAEEFVSYYGGVSEWEAAKTQEERMEALVNQYQKQEEQQNPNSEEPPSKIKLWTPYKARAHLIQFYTLHNPEKLKDAKNLLIKYSGFNIA